MPMQAVHGLGHFLVGALLSMFCADKVNNTVDISVHFYRYADDVKFVYCMHDDHGSRSVRNILLNFTT